MPQFTCPSCQATLNLDDRHLEKRVRCRCGFVFRATTPPRPSTQPEPKPPTKIVQVVPIPPTKAAQPPLATPIASANLIDPWSANPYSQPIPTAHPSASYYYSTPPKSKVAAGLFALFLGHLGIHNFYLGHTGLAVTQLCLTIVGIITACVIVGFFILAAVSVWTLVEAILCFSGGRFDAEGRPLI